MWTDINTKPKQGNVFRVFRGHVMGIPADYNVASFATRCNFRPLDWIPEPVLMLIIPKDWIATQECVGGDTKGSKPAATRPAAKVQFAVDVGCGGPVYTYAGDRTKSASTNQNGERTCMEPRDLLGSEAARENPRCSVGESVYSLSHF
jgi:hypothetical protein